MSIRRRRNKTRRHTSIAERKRRPHLTTRRLGTESLEDRRLLAGVTVGNALDLVNAPDTSSIAALSSDDGGDGISLREAILAANSTAGADTIDFDAGVFSTPQLITLGGTELAITDALTVTGPGQSNLTISGNNASRIFNIDDSNAGSLIEAQVADMTLTAGTAAGDGGAVANSENLVLRNLTLTDSTASGSGGALYSGASAVTPGAASFLLIENSSFHNNVANGAGQFFESIGGGSIFIHHRTHADDASVSVTMRDSVVSGSSAAGKGGGVLIDTDVDGGVNASASTLLERIDVNGNTSGYEGGGVATHMDVRSNTTASLSILDSSFDNNSAGKEGGGVYTENSAYGGSTVTTLISGNTVTNNSASSEGGGVYTENDANQDASVSNTTISDNVVSGNLTNKDGGGIYTDNDIGYGAGTSTTTTISNNLVTNNSAANHGGGIYTDNRSDGPQSSTHTTIVGGAVTGNTAARKGGGIGVDRFGDGSETVVIQGTHVEGNSAGEVAGGVWLDITARVNPAAGETVALTDLTIANNTAGGNGGGLYADMGSWLPGHRLAVTISNSEITGNTAVKGGGIYSYAAAYDPDTRVDFTIRDTLVANNSASAEGGGLFLMHEPNAIHNDNYISTTIENSDINRNTGRGRGGGVYSRNTDRGSLSINGGVIQDNHAYGSGTHGGGVFNYNNGGGALSVDGTVIDNNYAGSFWNPANGGGVYNRNAGGGTMTVASAKITDNRTSSSFAPPTYGGGVFNTNVGGGQSTIADTLIFENDSNFAGGGIYNSNSGGGDFSIVRSAVMDNSLRTNGLGGVGVFHRSVTDGGNLTITDSTIADNQGGGMGGGLYSFNYGTSTATIAGSTFSSNRAATGGGIHNINAQGGALSLAGSTITDNFTYNASPGGGLTNLNDGVGGVTELRSTILAGNRAVGTTAPDLNAVSANGGAAMVNAQFNLFGNVDPTMVNGVGGLNNQVGTAAAPIDARLAPLADNGGTTMTHLLLPDSPALDAGSSFGGTTEQRGFVRAADIVGPVNVDDGTDIGAAEGRSFTVDALGDEVDANLGTGQLTIREAVQAANAAPDGDAINFDLPLLSVVQLDDGELSVTEHLVVDGPGALELTIDAGGLSRIFNVDDGNSANDLDFSLRELTLSGGNAAAAGDGGAIRSLENLSLTDAVITGNTAEGAGGGVFVYSAEGGGKVAVKNVDFNKNSADPNQTTFSDGGALHVRAYSDGAANRFDVTIEDSTFTGNTSGAEGGAVYIRSDAENGATSDVSILASHVTGNVGLADGGGASIRLNARTSGYSTLLVEDSQFNGNSSDADGGGLYLVPDAGNGGATSATIRRSEFNANIAPEGGGLYVDNDAFNSGTSTFLMEDSQISANTANYNGGGLYLRGSAGDNYDNIATHVIRNSTISGNVVQTPTSGDGGGLYMRDNSTTGTFSLTVENSTIANNFAFLRGGAAYVKPYGINSTVEFMGSTISGNATDGSGGGVFAYGTNGQVIFTGSTVTSNTADQDSTGSDSGGGLFVGGGSVTLRNTIVAGNMDNSGTAADVDDAAMPLTASFSLVGDSAGASLTEAPVGSPDVNNNLIGGPVYGAVDPLLGPLQHNGGDTLTHALLDGSPARGVGNSFGHAVDQRGGMRTPAIAGSFSTLPGDGADMGAFEGRNVVVNQTGDVDDLDPVNGLTTLREALAITNTTGTFDVISFALPDPSTITLGGTELFATNSLVLNGPGRDVLTIDAGGQSRVMRIDDGQTGATAETVIRGLTLTGGNDVTSSSYGGGALLTSENLTIQSSRITNNVSDFEGGAVRTDADAMGIGSTAELVIADSDISNNSAPFGGGGAIWAHNDTIGWGSRTLLSVSNSVISGNSGSGTGGGISIRNSTKSVDGVSVTTFSDTTMNSNYIDGTGGAIAHDNSDTRYGTSLILTMEGGQITGNVADNKGGGLDLGSSRGFDAHRTIHGTTISGNTANEFGGGIHVNTDSHMRGYLSLQNVQLTGNSAGKNGGAIFDDTDPNEPGFRHLTLINDTLISGNSATYDGGGIDADISITSNTRGAEGRLFISGSTISDNAAAKGGGISDSNNVYTRTSETSIIGTTISGNLATGAGGGGGIYHDRDGSLRLLNSTVSGNSAAAGPGGGIHSNGVHALSVSQSTITANDASTRGGGVALADGRLATLHNVILAANASVSDPDIATGASSSATVAYSLVGDQGSANVIDTGNSQIGGNGNPVIDPKLDALADNGGPTQTHALQLDSPAMNAGDPAALTTFDQRGSGFDRVRLGQMDIGAYEMQVLAGDFDLDGDLDGNDIDALIANIAVGPPNPATFDLTADGAVDLADRDQWLALAGAMNLPSGNPYLLGDANLDGTVDGQDFIDWNSNKFTSAPAWTAGDFNADGVVDGQDYIIWNNHKFQGADARHTAGRDTLARVTDLALANLFDDEEDATSPSS